MMRRLLPRAARRTSLLADERGTSVIELAFVAPVLSLLTMGIIDLSNGFSRRMELTQAASRTLEQVVSDDFEIPEDADGDTTYEAPTLSAEAAAAAGVSADQVVVTRWLECDGVEQLPREQKFATGCAVEDRPECEVSDPPDDCHAVMARYIQVRIEDRFAPMFGTILSREADGTIPLWAEAAVRIQ